MDMLQGPLQGSCMRVRVHPPSYLIYPSTIPAAHEVHTLYVCMYRTNYMHTCSSLGLRESQGDLVYPIDCNTATVFIQLSLLSSFLFLPCWISHFSEFSPPFMCNGDIACGY